MSVTVAEAVTDGTFEDPCLLPIEGIGKRIKSGGAAIGTFLPEQESESTTLNARENPRVDIPLISNLPSLQPQGRFDVLQEYEGVVLTVDQESFWARLNNKTSPAAEDEEGEFPFEEVSRDDRWLVKPGSIFYWYIGYYDSASGQRTRQSIIRFRRLPAFASDDLLRARKKAKKLMETFREIEEDEAFGRE